MKIVNWNIEWMNDWFVGGRQVAFREKLERGGKIIIDNVADLCRRVANVIKELDPDVLTVQEGPSDRREMELFVKKYLKDQDNNPMFKVFGGYDGRSQKIYALVKTKGQFIDPIIVTDELTLDLKEPWLSDVDGDISLEDYEFTRTPVVIKGTWEPQGSKLKILVLHTKSKYVHRQQQLWENEGTRMQFVAEALKNRRRISSEAMRVRQYLNDLITADTNMQIVVTGDFNDGPGFDYFEKYYLTHNVTDILLGSTYYPDLLFNHGFLNRIPKDKRYTAIFDDFIDEIPNRKILLDHIIVSPALLSKIQDSGIAHEAFENAIDESASGRQKHPSDHRPIFVVFNI